MNTTDILTDQEKQDRAQTIMQQLGGKRFLLMTGAKDAFYESDGGLRFKLGRFIVQIKLIWEDLYTMRFRKGHLNRKTFDWVTTYDQTHEGIYADKMHEIIKKETGLYCSLGTMGGAL